MVMCYYSLIYYLSRGKNLKSFTDSDLPISNFGLAKAFNHDDNYGDYNIYFLADISKYFIIT